MKLFNNANRALGIPSALGSLIIEKGKSTDISPDDLEKIKKNVTAAGWLHRGLISVDEPGAALANKAKQPVKEKEKEKEDENPTGKAEIIQQSPGWYKVFVGDVEVSQGNLRKADAEALAAEYEPEEEEEEED